MKNKMTLLKNQKGQLVVEAVLLVVVMVALFGFFSNWMRNQEFTKKMISGPWLLLSGMIENGVWLPPEKARALHPNNLERNISHEGDQKSL
ncbi:MAG: hypothetical protein AB7O96_11340 [Pseudobdellovibrionaceae bacterium]